MKINKKVHILLIILLFQLPIIFALFTEDYAFRLDVQNIPPQFTKFRIELNELSMDITSSGKIKTSTSFMIKNQGEKGQFDVPTPNLMILPLNRNIDVENIKILVGEDSINYEIQDKTSIQFLNFDSDNTVSDTEKVFDNEGITILLWKLDFDVLYKVEFEIDPSLDIEKNSRFQPKFGLLFPYQIIEFKNVNIELDPPFKDYNTTVDIVKLQKTIEISKTLNDTTTLKFLGKNNLNLESKTRKKWSLDKENLFLFNLDYKKKSNFLRDLEYVISILKQFWFIILIIVVLVVIVRLIKRKGPKKGLKELGKGIIKKSEKTVGLEEDLSPNKRP